MLSDRIRGYSILGIILFVLTTVVLAGLGVGEFRETVRENAGLLGSLVAISLGANEARRFTEAKHGGAE